MIKGGVRGVGGSTHLVSYVPFVPMGDFAKKPIYLISDLKNDFFNDLKT